MGEPLPGTSKDEKMSDKDDDDIESAVIVKKEPENSYVYQQSNDLTTIVPVRRSSLAFLDPYFGLLLKENPLGINAWGTGGHCISIIESDFAALVLSGDKQIIRNGRVVKSFKVSAGNKHQYVLKTTESQKREINYLSQISRKYSPIKKVKHIPNARSTSQKALIKQSLLNFVVSNEWFAPKKPVLTIFENPEDVGDSDSQLVKWMDLKSCANGNPYSSVNLTPPVCVSDVITTSGFRSLVRSNEKLNLPMMLKTWSRDTKSNIFWKAAAVKSFGQKKLALQQTCSAADDITMNELAGYFDTLVHIPKEMSSMAKMMYQ